MDKLTPAELVEFWGDDPEAVRYAAEAYTDVPLTDALLAQVEAALEVRLPAAYVALMRDRNGGIPRRTWCHTDTAELEITGVCGIGRVRPYSQLGALGTPFMHREWGYPSWAVILCTTVSAGHDVVALDTRLDGEPPVVWICQSADFAVTRLADDTATFLRSLVDEPGLDADDPSDDVERPDPFVRVEAPFHASLVELIAAAGTDAGPVLRETAREVIRTNPHRVFTVTDTPASSRFLLSMFWVYGAALEPDDAATFADDLLGFFGRYDDFGPHAIAVDLATWVAEQVTGGFVVREGGVFRASPAVVDALRRR